MSECEDKMLCKMCVKTVCKGLRHSMLTQVSVDRMHSNISPGDPSHRGKLTLTLVIRKQTLASVIAKLTW